MACEGDNDSRRIRPAGLSPHHVLEAQEAQREPRRYSFGVSEQSRRGAAHPARLGAGPHGDRSLSDQAGRPGLHRAPHASGAPALCRRGTRARRAGGRRGGTAWSRSTEREESNDPRRYAEKSPGRRPRQRASHQDLRCPRLCLAPSLARTLHRSRRSCPRASFPRRRSSPSCYHDQRNGGGFGLCRRSARPAGSRQLPRLPTTPVTAAPELGEAGAADRAALGSRDDTAQHLHD